MLLTRQTIKRYYRLQQLELRFVLQMEWCITHHIRAQYIETTLLFEKFFASAMCIRQLYECNQLYRYIVSVVVVIVCNEHWEQGIQIELTCNSKSFSLWP